jgi:MFS family permease
VTRATWLALIAVSLNVFTAALDLTVMASVLPQLIVDFDVPLPGGLADTAWIVNGYLIAYVVTMPVMGKVSDLYGRRPVFLLSLAIFTIGSSWAALAGDVWTMVAARVVQALGGGAMVPVALAAVSDAVPPRHRALAIGTIAAVDTAGWVAGSAYGAWVTTLFGWRWAFWLNVPIALLGMLLVAWALPPGERAERRLDWIGAALFTLFLIAFTVALYLGAPASPESGALLAQQGSVERSPLVWPLLGVATLLLLLFIVWERRVEEPLIDLRLLAGRLFAMANSISLLTGIVLMAVMVAIPVLLQALSSSVEEAISTSGGLLAIFAGSMMAGALGGAPLLRWLSARWLSVVALLLSIAGLWPMAQWNQTVGIEGLRLPLAMAGLGLGVVTTAIATAVLNNVSEEERGIAASLLLVARLIGMTLGLSVLVTWALQRYEILLAAAEVPSLDQPDAFTQIAQVIARIMTTVVTDLFWVTALIAAIAVLPALLLRTGRTSS